MPYKFGFSNFSRLNLSIHYHLISQFFISFFLNAIASVCVCLGVCTWVCTTPEYIIIGIFMSVCIFNLKKYYFAVDFIHFDWLIF